MTHEEAHMNADQAKLLAQSVGQQLQNEWMTTYKVIAAVPEGKTRLQARTELPKRVGAGDAYGGRGRVVPRRRDQRRSSSKPSETAPAPTVAGVADWYKKEFPQSTRARAGARRPQAVQDRRLLRDEDAGRAVHDVRARPHGPPPRSAGDLSAPDGRQGAQHLRRQLRRDSGRGRTEPSA